MIVTTIKYITIAVTIMVDIIDIMVKLIAITI